MDGACNSTVFVPGPGEESKGYISLNFNCKVNIKDFYIKLCMSSHKLII